MKTLRHMLAACLLSLALMINVPVSNVQAAAKTYKVTMTIVGIDKKLKAKTVSKGSVTMKKNSTIYQTLKAFCKKKKLDLKSRGYGPTRYVYKIGDFKERQHGALSGWMYSVDGVFPNKSAGAYRVTKKITVKWVYVNATK